MANNFFFPIYGKSICQHLVTWRSAQQQKQGTAAPFWRRHTEEEEEEEVMVEEEQAPSSTSTMEMTVEEEEETLPSRDIFLSRHVFLLDPFPHAPAPPLRTSGLPQTVKSFFFLLFEAVPLLFFALDLWWRERQHPLPSPSSSSKQLAY